MTPSTTPSPDAFTDHSHPRGASSKATIEAAKEAVPVIDLADRLCGPGQLRKVGKEWVGRCPLPNHPDKTPSFSVDPVKNLFFCHGCLRGGDTISLACFAWNFEKEESAEAAAYLLLEFGHELPPRDPRWFTKQRRQQPIRDALKRSRVARLQRRLFRLYFAPGIQRIADEGERVEEARRGWEEAGWLARMADSRFWEGR